MLVEPGQMIAQGTTLATILPADDELEAHLYSPSRSIGFVRAGQTVLLRYLAYPHPIRSLNLTRLIIAYRPETIASAERVIVLQGGKVTQDLRRVAV